MNQRSESASGNSTGRRQRLLASASALVLGLGCTVQPAQAQMARLQGAVGAVPVITPGTTGGTAAALPQRSVRMQEALAAQQAARDAVKSMRGLVTQAREAALAATRARPTDGLSIKGLNPAVTKVTASVDDATGLGTWQGALLPTQTEAGGKFTVTIKQTESRALLSWNNFDIGAKTTLVFDQSVGGKAQTDWVVLNRVVDPGARPSTILGSIKAPGTVLVLNRSGVIFGNGAQVNVHSLLASSLEIGNFAKDVGRAAEDANFFTGLSLKERNTAYLENGLLGPSSSPGKYNALLTSSLAGSGRYVVTNPDAAFSATPEGDVVVDRGASISASGGGFVILTAPNVSNDGQLSAPEGQVSLQAGRAISYTVSTGSAKGADPDIRGLILRTLTEDGGAVVNSGLIDVPRGYISLGSDLAGSVVNAGLLASTTSVSRNGTISLTAGTIRISGGSDTAHAGGLVILNDASTETVPQGTAAEPPAFKTSRIDIGGAYVSLLAGGSALGLLGPASVDFGANSLLLAPAANVAIGSRASQTFDAAALASTGRTVSVGSITVGEGVRIDVSGIKDVTLEASRNAVTISPLKGNELRDTPNYRDVRTDGSFTLNGKTVTIDPRRSGVRADGVKWIGSPLIEAGSAASQIGVGAAELMTKGGTVTFGVAVLQGADTLANTPQVKIAKSATVDFSGGWVHYNAGWVGSSRLIRADGSLVDIADADPNGVYIGLADGFTELQSKFGKADTFTNRVLAGQRFDPSYDEGRDAGGMVVIGSTASIRGTLHGDAFAGERQLRAGVVGTAAPGTALDTRQLQSTAQQLPSGGFLRVGSFSGPSGVGLGGDILVHAAGAQDLQTGKGVFLLSDRQLSEAGLSALTLQTSGGVTFGEGSNLVLANGGKLTVDAGRTINFDGTVTARGGSIAARTYELAGTIYRSSIAATGSVFDTADDAKFAYARGEALPGLFDINVNGTLDVAGLWSNDFLALGKMPSGQAWTSGGAISLTVAPKVLLAEGTDLESATYAVDLSGSIRLAKDALLNVSSGGYVDPTGALALTARGGSVSLINATTYASLSQTPANVNELSTTDLPVGGENQSVAFSPYTADNGKLVRGALAPREQRSTVSFEAANFKGFSFGGGGTFKLVAPQIALGGTRPQTGSWLGLDFLQQTGFGGLDLTTFRSRVYDDLFKGGVGGGSAFFETTRFVIGKGETLNLSQALLPNFVDPATSAKLATLATGSDVTSVVSASVPTEAFDQRAATLTLGGLTELTVAKGGTITGAAGASITAPKLLNQGTIRIVGGKILQRAVLPEVLFGQSIGVKDAANGGRGLDDVLGGRIEGAGSPQYSENAKSKVSDADGLLTNGELFSKAGSDQTVYFLGALDKDQGIKLDAGSVTDLSGGAVFDPRAPVGADGRRLARGTLYDGGSISTASTFVNPANALFSTPNYGDPRYQVLIGGNPITYAGSTAGAKIAVGAGALIDIRGAAAQFDQQDSSGNFVLADQWSKGGSIRVLAGGSLAGARIRSAGGAPAAEGGTLEWFAPTLISAYGDRAGESGLLSAAQIEDAGFTTMIARGSLTVEGGTRLSLGKAFILSSADLPTSSVIDRDLQVRVRLSGSGDAAIEAPYIRLSSLAQSAPGNLDAGTAGELTFAGKSVDLVGGLGFSAGEVRFEAERDVRLIGVKQAVPSLTVLTGVTGSIVASGDIAFKASQIYATTGTGNLQALIEDQRNGTSNSAAQPYLIASFAENGTISFASNGGAVPDSPLSAGSWLRVLAAQIRQDGVLRAPLGLIELGSSAARLIPGSLNLAPATRSITFGAGSVTSVSGTGLNVPYGQTTDLTEYYFAPGVSAALTTAPTGQLVLSGADITIGTGAKIDGRGGGDVFAYEFVSGTGGSRDVLSRLNADAFSSNDGLQYADGRQVYAILPVEKAGLVAGYDPIYSDDYGAGTGDLYGASAGRTVHLDGGPGVPAGDFLLLPAHYALLPGALRLVENTDAQAPYVGASTQLLDGSVQVGGTFGTAGTAFRDSQRRSFTVQSADTFKKYSKLQVTSGTENFDKLADKQGRAAPRSPLDAARFVIRPGESFTAGGTFDVGASGKGRGAQFDIAASAIAIRSAAGGADTPGVLSLSTETLANLNANSLLLGGVRQDKADGTTRIDVTAKTISIANGVSLSLPEMIFAVAGEDSRITVGAGASLTATGTLADLRTGNFVVGYEKNDTGVVSAFDNTGIGALLRLSSGPDRLVTRNLDPDATNAALASASLRIASGASLKGNSVALGASGTVRFGSSATLDARAVSLSGVAISFGSGGIDADFAAKLAAADRLTLQSRRVITLGDALPERFNTLAIDAPGLAADGSDVTLRAKAVEFGNAGADRGGCSKAGVAACGSANALTVKADEISFGSGTFRLYGFDSGVTLDAAKGIYVTGKGALALDDPDASGPVRLTMKTPLLADRSATTAADVKSGGADYAFLTRGRVIVDGTGRTAPTASPAASAGSIIAFGSADSAVAGLTLNNTTVRATAGIVEARARGDIAITGTTTIAAPGFTTRIGATEDALVATAGGGTITLQSNQGNVSLAKTASLIVDNGIGSAGALNLVAARGTIDLGASLNGGIGAGKTRAASLLLDGAAITDGAGGAFDFGTFVSRDGAKFGGALQIHTGTGNLALAAGQTVKARSVTLATDQGRITIAGTIDTSGADVSKLKLTDPAYATADVNGGDIALYGADGVTLAATGKLLARTSGYGAGDSRQAHGGNVTLGIAADTAAVTVASGAVIDVSATRPGDRLVSTVVKDPATLTQTTAFRLAAGDLGGTVTFRAPVIENDSKVDIRSSGTITGAREVAIHAFKRFDLDAIAASGAFSGISLDGGGNIHLDAAATGKPNFLADLTASGTLPQFVRNFSVTLKNGGSLAGIRVRPEMELSATRGVILDSNINLGAGRITDYVGALADGFIVPSELGPDANGNPRYEVVAGKEAALFAKYVDMTYRVGGKVTGEAGVFTLRAGGSVQVANSISDGFFAFHDRTDADYIQHQLGGGDRSFHPAIQLDCAFGGLCDDTLPSYSARIGRRPPADDELIVIDLSLPVQGTQSTPIFVHSPYSASANSVAANGTGNGIGVGELFPLVDGKAVASSDIRLIAGAAAGSADPTQLDRSSKGDVVIAGEKSYSVVAREGRYTIGGGVQLGFDQGDGTYIYGNTSGDFFTRTFADITDPATARDFYTKLTWGSDSQLSDEALAAAQTFFAGNRFIREDGVVTGVYASLGQVADFLAGDYGTTYRSLVAPDISIETDVPVSYPGTKVFYRPLVRTGDGNIKIAAARDIDLVGSSRVTYRDLNSLSRDEFGDPLEAGFDNAQVGGSAVYTAGTRLAKLGSVSLDAASFDKGTEKLDYIPSTQGALDFGSALTGNGGNVTLVAGRDVIGRRDVWTETFLDNGLDIETTLPGYESGTSTLDTTRVGSASQRWRLGRVGLDSTIAIVPQLFTSGVGALSGGDVTITAGRDVSDLTVALDNSVVTQTDGQGRRVLVTSAGGNLSLSAGRDLLGGQIDLAQGIGRIAVGRSVGAAGETLTSGSYEDRVDAPDRRNLLRVRVSDATVSLTARGTVDLGGLGALGANEASATIDLQLNTAGFFSPIASFSAATMGTLNLAANRREQRVLFTAQDTDAERASFLLGNVLPPSLLLSSLSGDLQLGNGSPLLLYPSRYGQLSLVAGGDMGRFALAMSDANPSDLPGAFTVSQLVSQSSALLRLNGLGFTFGGVVQPTDDVTLRLLHDRNILHAGDIRVAEIFAGGSISQVQLNLAKAARINAGLDIVDFYFEGQNLAVSDVTSVLAGRDITATTQLPDLNNAFTGRPFTGITNFVVGGPGTLTVQAGRDLGPFLNSATVGGVSYAGGIRTIGNEANPWLPSQGADIYALFGVAKGADYTALRSTYLDPANLAKLDGDLFVQNVDSAGNRTPDRSKPIYAPKLALWLKDNAPTAFASVFADNPGLSGDALTAAAYGRLDKLYAAFTGQVSELQQRQFLIREVYFGEIAAPADPKGASYQQYVRGYRAIQTLFPATLGYTDNLATFETDPASVSADHPLGEAVKKIVDGEPARAARIITGNVDLRLATIETGRGGTIDILGPGGDLIAGSVVRTSEQAARKTTLYSQTGVDFFRNGFGLNRSPVGIEAIPIGFEGVLSLRGGSIQSFTDGDFRLNQSRLFTLAGGDITMWSSNGDLNAGQGPKTASNFPPIVLRFTPNAVGEVDSVGSVSGAGIAALRPSLDVAPSRVTLIAPVGTVDAGDAGVRASGDVFVAAARVANADNFKVGGVSVGVPTTAVVAAPAAPASAAAATAATAAQAGAQQRSDSADRRSIIRVDVLGFIGGDSGNCPSGRFDSEGRCVN
ncbi:filamentous haemagglutinin family protein [Novosphingobium sp.]|uniref:filamentous haemagglutinin family protein n=1 Tax=Novosphingobium sp. TaxID=1874826 RepID=UPI00260BB7F9|nr:filamentous haemagglutinin family protein [Novosphingobium sp.]